MTNKILYHNVKQEQRKEILKRQKLLHLFVHYGT